MVGGSFFGYFGVWLAWQLRPWIKGFCGAVMRWGLKGSQTIQSMEDWNEALPGAPLVALGTLLALGVVHSICGNESRARLVLSIS